jgi:hypothetical protein
MSETWSDEVMAHRETEIAEEAFQNEEWDTGLERVDGAPEEFQPYRHERLGDAVVLVGGYERYTLTADRSAADDLRKEVAKLSRKLTRHGGEVRIVAEEETQHEHKWLRKRGKPITIYQTIFTIEAPAVAGENAKLIGTFELAEDGEQVYRNALPGYTETDLEPFIGRWWECDHCGYNRKRHASFVCEKTDGSRMLIGRQCSMSYMGLSPADILARAAIAKALGGGEDEERSLSGGSYYLYMETVVQNAYRVAKKFGGYSRDGAEAFYRDMAALQGERDYGRDRTNQNIRDEYKERDRTLEPLDYNALADYVEGATDTYGENLRIALTCTYIKPKRYRTVVSGVGMFVGRSMKRAQAAAVEAKSDRPAAKHLDGAVGARVDFVGTVERVIPLESDFGPKSLIAIVCDDGTRCVHYCTAAQMPEAGKVYGIRATIKEHGTNKKFGTPQSVITRAAYGPVPADQPKLI